MTVGVEDYTGTPANNDFPLQATESQARLLWRLRGPFSLWTQIFSIV